MKLKRKYPGTSTIRINRDTYLFSYARWYASCATNHQTQTLSPMQVSLISITSFRFHMFVLTLQHSPLSNFLKYHLVFTIYTTQCSFDGSKTYEHAHKRFRNKLSRSVWVSNVTRMFDKDTLRSDKLERSGKNGSNNGDSSAPPRAWTSVAVSAFLLQKVTEGYTRST